MKTKKIQLFKDFIKDFYLIHGILPTFDELGEKLPIKSKSSIHDYMNMLVEEKFLTRIGFRFGPGQEIRKHIIRNQLEYLTLKKKNGIFTLFNN